MGDMGYLLEPELLNSIVLGAAQKAAERADWTIEAPALDLLLRESLPALNKANEDGTVDQLRNKWERNTAELIQFIVREQLTGHVAARKITYQHMVTGLSAFCRLFPDFAPFCKKE